MSTMKNWLPVLLILACIGIIIVAVASNFTFSFNNNGEVKNINVAGFLEPTYETPLTEITWPTIGEGETSFQLIYVNSTSTIPAVLNLTTADWTPPEAEALITYTWDLEGTTILPNTVLQANITLTLAADMGDVTTYDFTAIINAEEP